MTNVTEFLAEQKRLAEAATEGPWEVDQSEPGIWGPQHIVIGNYTASDMFESPAWENGKPEDLAFIAAARESVPRMIAALEAVTDVHRRVSAPWPHSGGTFVCRADNGLWPCPTIRAIEAALGGESDGE